MRNKEELTPYIFISYSHDDIDFAKNLINRLETDGFAVWIDINDIRANEKFTPEIEKGIFECSVFISLLSKTYINKDFCKEEIACARHFNKELIPLHIEKVIIPPGSGFNLSFSASQLGYGRDIVSEKDFEEVYNKFIESLELFFESKSEPTRVKSNINFNALRKNFEQLSFGGYVSSEIYTELFPSIIISKETDDESFSADGEKKLVNSNNNNKLLVEYIEKNSTSHIFINGEGGSGKTVALKLIFEDFFEKEIPTIYVPLNKVGFSNTDALQRYIGEIACKNAEWHNIRQLAMNNSFIPRVVLMLDGLNEINGDIREVVRQISEMMYWSNLQIIITSRIDYTPYFSDMSEIKRVDFKPITTKKICTYLEKRGVHMVTNKQLLHLLSNPMMLMLYTETKTSTEYLNQTLKSNYNYNYFPINITKNPNTAGKIIWNYIVSQLYKVSKQTTSSVDIIDCFATIELFLPFLGYSLVSNDEQTSVEFGEYDSLICDFQNTDYYKKYVKQRIVDLKIHLRTAYDISQYDTFNFVNITTNQLHFINESDNKLEFVHQVFRDFFAALHIAKQIEGLLGDKEKKEYAYKVVTNQMYSKYIIEYLVDILDESAARPFRNGDTAVYPGKSQQLSPSDFSIAEKALSTFKEQVGTRAQTGVANLFEIMKLGRVANLSNCDFRKLDLRLCKFSSVKFVSWFENETYPSSFDEAYMDIESFISPGHNIPISAVHVCDNKIFTGDLNGNVKVWTLDSDYPIGSYKATVGEVIIDIAYSVAKNILAVLTSHRLYSVNADSGCADILCETHNHFKYVKVDVNGEFLISTDTEPLTWKDILWNEKEKELPFDITCGCAAKNPTRDEFILGVLYNNALMFRKESDGKYSVSRRIDMYNEHAHIRTVCYNADGTKFIVATNKTVTEFDSGSLLLRHRMTFDGSVNSVEYFDDKIVIANGRSITVLNSDFSVNKKIEGKRTPPRVSVLIDNKKVFVCSPKSKIFELNSDFTVRRSRNINTGTHICTGNYANVKPCFILVNDGHVNETGYRYDFETGEYTELTFNYEINTESYSNATFPYEINKRENVVIFTNKTNIEDKKKFVFYSDINIFACSFKNIEGNLKKAENIETIIMYGGVI